MDSFFIPASDMEKFERVNPPVRKKRTSEHADKFDSCLEVGDGFTVMLDGLEGRREAKNLRAHSWRMLPWKFSVNRIVGGILVKRVA